MSLDYPNNRRKWGKCSPEIHKKHDRTENIQAKQVSEAHDYYLFKLQEKNRMLKQLRRKDPKKIDTERKEQGFSLYVNGANRNIGKNGKRNESSPVSDGQPMTSRRNIKTAFERYDDNDNDPIDVNDPFRSKTAPEKGRRKNWKTGAVHLKSEAGEKFEISAPRVLTGEYSEDFDSEYSYEMEDDDDDDRDEISKQMAALLTVSQNMKSVDVKESSSDHIMLRMKDIKYLRKSLAEIPAIKKSCMLSKQLEDDVLEVSEEIHSEDEDEEDEDIEEIKDSRHNPFNKVKQWSPEEMIVLEFAPSNKGKNRQLAATKTKDRESMDDKSKAMDVIAAINSENKNIKSKQKGKVESANVNQLNEDNLEWVVDRVLEMDSQSQNKLLTALDKLESCVEESTRPSNRNDVDVTPSRRKPVESLKKSYVLSSPTAIDCVGLKFDIISNWGHANRIGLTGIEVFDEENRVVGIKEDDVRVTGAENVKGDIAVLFNGKNKTIKERHMWSCEYFSGHKISLCIKIPKSSLDSLDITKIKVWNYNKSLSDLNIGVKDIVCYRDDNIIFEGEIDKGCGNQVFDYSKTINLNSVNKDMSKKPVNTKSGALTPRSSQGPGVMSVSRKQKSDSSVSSQSLDTESRSSKKSDSKSSHKDDISRKSQNKSKNTGNADEKLSDTSRSVAASQDVCMLQQLRQVTKTKGGKPHWLEAKQAGEIDRGSSPKPQWLEEERIESPRPGSFLIDSLKLDWPVRGTQDLATVLDSQEHFEKRINSGRRASNKNEPVVKKSSGDLRKENIIRSNLEESWTSLSFFEKSHRGRISTDMEGDVLDSYLGSDKKQTHGISVKPIEEKDEIEKEEVSTSVTENDEFIIPELPYGKELIIDIQTTWGDKHYVGLTGIEIYTKEGTPAPISKVMADPADINVLPEYGKDPRIVDNLLDGINRTRDDTHMWLAPFNQGKKHIITVKLSQACNIAMMRIWNYNKSRIHSYRGAKDVVISLDGKAIFKGEISRACGGIIGGTEAFGDTILFTMDEDILERVSHYDEAFEEDLSDEWSDDDGLLSERPGTGDGSKERPYTTARISQRDKPETLHVKKEGDVLVYKGKSLVLNFTDTWGDVHYLGLTGLEVVGSDGEPVPLSIDMLQAIPEDLRCLPGCENDDRTLDKLINGTCVTMSDAHMWMIPFTEDEDHTLNLEFEKPTEITGIRIWNYNKSHEDTYRGAKRVHVHFDGQCISPPEGYLIRKGPGNCHFDFAQEISFTNDESTPDSTSQKSSRPNIPSDSSNVDYEAIPMPYGFIYQLRLFSTWGDPYYVGLNGLEFFDKDGHLIALTENNISAFPDSVNVIDGVENDVRTPDKLIDGIYDTEDGSHMWLAPILPNIVTRIYVIFDQPVSVSMIRLWNYSKTASRGVKDFGLYVDDLLVYNGTLDTVTQARAGILPTVDIPAKYYTVVFSTEKKTSKKSVIKTNAPPCQDVQMTNDRTVVTKYQDPNSQSQKPVDQDLRPKTCVPPGRNSKR